MGNGFKSHRYRHKAKAPRTFNILRILGLLSALGAPRGTAGSPECADLSRAKARAAQLQV